MFILHVHNVTVHIIGLMKHHASNNFNDDRKLLRPDQPPKMTILQIQICISFGQKYINCQCRHSVSFYWQWTHTYTYKCFTAIM